MQSTDTLTAPGMTVHRGTCKFCGATLMLAIDPACDIRDAREWVKLAACNRCADFRMQLLKLGDKCYWFLGRLHDVSGSRSEATIRAEVREKLCELTRRITRLICDHYRLEPHWEESIVDDMLAHPGKVRFIIGHLRAAIEQTARKQPRTDRAP